MNRTSLPAPSLPSLTIALTYFGALILAVAGGIAVALYGVLTVGLALAPVAVVVAWKRPGIVFALYLAIPFYKSAVDDLFPIDLTVVLAGLCMVAAVPNVAPWLRSGVPREHRRALALWGLAALVVILGSAYPFAPEGARTIALQFLALTTAAGLVGIRVAADPRTRNQFAWTMLAVGVFATIVGFLGLGEEAESLRLTTLDANPISTAQANLLVPLVGVPLMWRYPAARLALLFLVPVAVTTAMATGSRGPLVAAVVAAVAMAVMSSRGDKRFSRLGIVGLAAAVAVVAGLPSILAQWVPVFAMQRLASLQDSVRSLVTGGGSGEYEQARVEAWGLAGRMFDACPVLGCGTGSFAQQSPSIGYPDITYPHNYFLQAAAEYGLIGLVVFGGILVLALRAALRPQPDPATTAIATITVFFALGAMVSFNLTAYRALWGVMLIMLALHHSPLPTSPPTPRLPGRST